MTLTAPAQSPIVGPRYKWVVLSNTTVGVLLATTNATSLMIALPVIFRGIHLDPLVASNFPYLLWILMGYMLVMAAVVVTVGRIGDIFGRVKMYNLGFAWFTLGAILLSLVWSTGSDRGPGTHHPADVPGDRRGAAHGELGRDHHRRLSRRTAGSRPRDEHGRRHPRLVPRHPRWGPARPGGVALGVPRQRAHRGLRDHLGVSEAEGDRDPHPGPDRLVGKHRLRWWPRHAPHRIHLRHQALRALAHRLGEPLRSGDDLRWPGSDRRLPLYRDEGGGTAIPTVALPDPGVQRWQRCRIPGFGWPRWLPVHVDDLVPGHLAARARLQLHRHAPVGGRLHVAVHARLRPVRAAVGEAFGPLRGAAPSRPRACWSQGERSPLCCFFPPTSRTGRLPR